MNKNKYHIIEHLLGNSRNSLLIFLRVFVPLCLSLSSHAQILTPLSSEFTRRAEYRMIENDKNEFTLLKPYEFCQSMSSDHPSGSWLKRKLLYESFIQVDSSDYTLFVDPAFDFSIGHDDTGRKTFTNTRGLNAGAQLGKSFAFGTTFYEDQAIFPTYMHNQINKDKNHVVTGQGRGRLTAQTWDYAHASGYLSFTPVRNLNVLLGQWQNFIGDGYRSLLLSDVAYNYPYSRITWQNGTFMYSWMLGIIQDLSIPGNNKYTYLKRMISSRLLAVNLGRSVQFGIIENTVFDSPDSTGRFSPGMEEFNPVILPFRSENSHNIWGINLKMKVSKSLWLYGQSMFDNLFSNEPVRVGLQAGTKYFNAFGLKGLYLQFEYNRIDPKSYTSPDKPLQWMHYGESMAHPYGNNLEEGIFQLTYTWKRWQLQNFSRLTRNLKQTETSRFGFPSMSQGSEIVHTNTQLNWFLNLRTTAHFSIGYVTHDEKNVSISNNYFYFAFRTSLFNNYLEY